LVAGLTVTVKEVASLMNVIVLTSLAVAVTGLRSGVASNENRLSLEGGSNIANPNDMAFAVLLGIPFCLLFMQAGGLGRKVLGLAALAPMLVCFLKTGSRAGMLAFCTMALATFLRASIGGKLKIVVATVLTGVLGFAILPPSLRHRYITLTTAEEGADERVLEIAASSTASREALLRQALKITATHPLFGVGPGNFTYVENQMDIENGARKGMWQEAHDTYAQLAADCGIPALIIFVCLLGSSIRSVAAVRKRLADDSRPLARQIVNAAQASETLLWGMVVFMFFGHMAYAPVVYLLFTTAMVVARAANREVPALAAVPQAPLAMPARHWVAAS
jgi:O-antigen ligase